MKKYVIIKYVYENHPPRKNYVTLYYTGKDNIFTNYKSLALQYDTYNDATLGLNKIKALYEYTDESYKGVVKYLKVDIIDSDDIKDEIMKDY